MAIAVGYGSGRCSSSASICPQSSRCFCLSASGMSARISSSVDLQGRSRSGARSAAGPRCAGPAGVRQATCMYSGSLLMLLRRTARRDRAFRARLLGLLERLLQFVDALLRGFVSCRLPLRRPADSRPAWWRRTPPGCGSSPSAESDRTCGCGSARSRTVMPRNVSDVVATMSSSSSMRCARS